MKTSLSFVVVASCGLLMSSASGENSTAPAPNARTSATASATSTPTETPIGPAVAPPVQTKAETHSANPTASTREEKTPSLAEDETAEEAKQAHIRPTTAGVTIDAPPPPARSEVRPSPPASNLVWVPGDWAVVKNEWQWTPGEWRVPATPISVWIEGSYDPKTKRWTPGYWQPDREQPYDTEAPSIDQSNRVRF